MWRSREAPRTLRGFALVLNLGGGKQLVKFDECLNSAAGSTGRRNTVHPYRQESEAYGLLAT
jgi:hypothetical protein